MLFKQFQQMKFLQLITSKWLAKPIFVALELGLFEVISKTPKNIEDIAIETHTKSEKLFRLLRALSSFGIFKQCKNSQFKSNGLSDLLKSEDIQAMIGMFQSQWHDNAWNHLSHTIKSDANAFELGNGVKAFDFFNQNPKAADQFNHANAIKAQRITKIINKYDFSKYKSVTDIGGGYGNLLLNILLNNPHLSGNIIDLDYLKDGAEKNINSHSLQKRCNFVIRDFFKNILVESDIYIICNILHDWDDEQALNILNNCKNAMSENSKLLIIEMIIPKNTSNSVATLMDLEVLVMGNGKERTKMEFHTLIEEASLRKIKEYKFSRGYHIIECEGKK